VVGGKILELHATCGLDDLTVVRVAALSVGVDANLHARLAVRAIRLGRNLDRRGIVLGYVANIQGLQ